MAELDLTQQLQYMAHLGLEWVGFGTLAGLTAKAIMPGRDPGGTLTTLLMGIFGSVVGGGTLALWMPTYRVTPISLLGFIFATVGALIILGFYRLFVGKWKLPDRAPSVVTTTQVVPEPVLIRRKKRAVRYEYEE